MKRSVSCDSAAPMTWDAYSGQKEQEGLGELEVRRWAVAKPSAVRGLT
jgi:hypothetical protein